MISDKKKISKEKIRRIWIICALSDRKAWKQEQIICYLNNKSNEMLKLRENEQDQIYNEQLQEVSAQFPDTYNSNDKINNNDPNTKFLEKKDKSVKIISKGMISRILKSLKTDGIIQRTTIEKVGRDPDHYGYSLIEDYNSFKKILAEFLDPMLDNYLSSYLSNLIMISKYADKIVNLKLVDQIGKNWNIQFDISENNMILEIIKISPRALFKSLNAPNLLGFKPYPSFEAIYHSNKNEFFFNLEMSVGEDIMYLSPLAGKEFEYKIIVSINKKNIEATITPKSSNELSDAILLDNEFSPI